MTGADRLRAHLDALGISQNDAAWATGADLRTVRRWAAGGAPLPASVDTLLSVMRKYGLSVDQVRTAWEECG